MQINKERIANYFKHPFSKQFQIKLCKFWLLLTFEYEQGKHPFSSIEDIETVFL